MGKFWVVVWCGVVLMLFIVGCQSAIEPAPEPRSDFVFTPQPANLEVAAGQFLDFQVRHEFDPVFTVAWYINGIHVGIGPRYRFIPATTSVETLTALAVWQENSELQTWIIDSMHDTPTVVDFTPAADPLATEIGDAIGFNMSSSRASLTTYLWRSGGRAVSQEASFSFVPAATGWDSVHATAITPDHTEHHSWAIQTFATGLLPPLSPPLVTVRSGRTITSLEVSWKQAESRGLPVATYLVALSYDGPIDAANWEGASVLTEVPFVADQAAYAVSYNSADHGLLPGAHVWLTVRSVNSNGIQSLTTPNADIEITEPWWVTGTVMDETQTPLADILVRNGNNSVSTRTEADGSYRIGPFNSALRFRLRTDTPDLMPPGEVTGAWHDTVSQELGYEFREQWDFNLITQYSLISNCEPYRHDFPTYLRSITRTTFATENRPNQNLYKWESYPVPVWVPDFIAGSGLNYGDLCRETVTWWNEAMGEDYLTLVTDRAAARITFRFADDGPDYLGTTFLREPHDNDYVMGDVVPEQVEVYLLDRLTTAQLIQEISLHELGHALGLAGHAVCYDSGYLMYISPVGALNNGVENAIHVDEKHALGIVKYMPQGFDMSGLTK